MIERKCHILKDFNNTLSNTQLMGDLAMKISSQWQLTPRECEVSLKSSHCMTYKNTFQVKFAVLEYKTLESCVHSNFSWLLCCYTIVGYVSRR